MSTIAYYQGMQDFYQTIGNIEAIAQKSGISMRSICQEADVANSTYTRWKAKKTEPNYSTAVKFISTANEILGIGNGIV